MFLYYYINSEGTLQGAAELMKFFISTYIVGKQTYTVGIAMRV